MSEVTNSNPAAVREKSVKTVRVAGKQSFGPPGSGGSRPEMKLRDLDFIPEMVGENEKQPAGAHIHDRARTGTTVGKAIPLVDANAKVTGQAWYGDDVRLPNEIIGRIVRFFHTIMLR